MGKDLARVGRSIIRDCDLARRSSDPGHPTDDPCAEEFPCGATLAQVFQCCKGRSDVHDRARDVMEASSRATQLLVKPNGTHRYGLHNGCMNLTVRADMAVAVAGDRSAIDADFARVAPGCPAGYD